jgi:hypothetical protein
MLRGGKSFEEKTGGEQTYGEGGDEGCLSSI